MLFSRPWFRLQHIASLRSIPSGSPSRHLRLSRFYSSTTPLPTNNMERVDTLERLAKLRRLMQENNVDVYSG